MWSETRGSIGAAVVVCIWMTGGAVAPALAQEPAPMQTIAPAEAAGGVLDGFIRDPTGKLALGARVRLFDWTAHTEKVATATKDTAYFVFADLPLHDYMVVAEARSLKAAQAVTLTPQHPRERVLLTLSIVWQDSAIVSEHPLILPQNDATTFSHDTLEGLLANGRTLQNIFTLVPGVVVTESSGTLAQVTAMGQRRFANRISIDGISGDLSVDASGRGAGEAGGGALPAMTTVGSTQTLVPAAAIQEIEVRTTNTAPEYAHTPGAQTSVRTRAGTNVMRGWAFFDTRPNRLAADDWFVNASSIPRHDARSQNFGESLGGPIISHRLFFFAAYEALRIDRSVATTIQVPSRGARERAGALRPLLDSFPVPNGPDRGNNLADFSHQFPVRSSVDSSSVRVDRKWSAAYQGFVRIHYGASAGDELSGEAVRLPALSFRQRAATSTWTITGGFDTAASRFTHELRGNFSGHHATVAASPAEYGDAQPLPMNLLLPREVPEGDAAVSVFFVAAPDQGGRVMSGRTLDARQQQFQLADTMSYTVGKHLFRFGGSYTVVNTTTAPSHVQYTYRFADVNQLIQGHVSAVSALYREPADVRRQTFSVFAQDTWQANPRLSLNYGLRHSIRPAPVSTTYTQPMLIEYESLPDIVTRQTSAPLWNTSWFDLQSNLSMAMVLNGAEGRETGLRAGASLLFDDLTSPGLSAFTRGFPYASLGLFGGSVFPVSDDVLTELRSYWPSTAGAYAEVYAIPRDLCAPFTYEWQLAITQSLGRHHLDASYVGTVGRRLIYWQAFQPEHPKLLVEVFSNDASSDYHALLLQYRYPLHHGLHARFNYAWSHAIDTDSGEELDPHPLTRLMPPSLNRGNADFDRRHVLHATLSFRLPSIGPAPVRVALDGWQIDLVGSVQSGAPVSVTARQSAPFGVMSLRPDVIPGAAAWIQDPGSPVGRRLNPEAFVIPDVARMGTLGRNTFRGTPLRQLDVLLSRAMRLGKFDLQFRLAVFNVLNTPNFGPPDGDLASYAFGRPIRSYAEALGSGTLTLGGLVPMQQAGGPRAIQLGFRFAL